MEIKNEGLKSFLQKMRFRYRVSVLNENSLEETRNLGLSRLSVFLVASSLFVFTFADAGTPGLSCIPEKHL